MVTSNTFYEFGSTACLVNGFTGEKGEVLVAKNGANSRQLNLILVVIFIGITEIMNIVHVYSKRLVYSCLFVLFTRVIMVR